MTQVIANAKGKIIKLKSPDSRTHQAVYPNYLAAKTDQKAILRSIQIAQKIAVTIPFQNYITQAF